MWVLFAILSAVFAGINGILGKYGVKKVDATLATALRTVVVLGIAWGAVAVGGGWRELFSVGGRSLLFLSLSGVATALAWLFYFRALAAGAVNRVAAVDKFSTVLTMLGGWVFLGEEMSVVKVVSMGMIVVGILLMIEKESNEVDKIEHTVEPKRTRKSWLVWGLLSVLSVTAATLLSKAGVGRINSDLALAVRTVVVLIVSWGVVLWNRRRDEISKIDGRSMLFVMLSGAATGFGWLCYFRALSAGDAGVVHPVDKLSILVTVILSSIFLKEKTSLRAGVGLLVITVGIALLIII